MAPFPLGVAAAENERNHSWEHFLEALCPEQSDELVTKQRRKYMNTGHTLDFSIQEMKMPVLPLLSSPQRVFCKRKDVLQILELLYPKVDLSAVKT